MTTSKWLVCAVNKQDFKKSLKGVLEAKYSYVGDYVDPKSLNPGERLAIFYPSIIFREFNELDFKDVNYPQHSLYAIFVTKEWAESKGFVHAARCDDKEIQLLYSQLESIVDSDNTLHDTGNFDKVGELAKKIGTRNNKIQSQEDWRYVCNFSMPYKLKPYIVRQDWEIDRDTLKSLDNEYVEELISITIDDLCHPQENSILFLATNGMTKQQIKKYLVESKEFPNIKLDEKPLDQKIFNSIDKLVDRLKQ